MFVTCESTNISIAERSTYLVGVTEYLTVLGIAL